MTRETASFAAGLSVGSLLILFVYLCGGSVPAVTVGIHGVVTIAWAYDACRGRPRVGSSTASPCSPADAMQVVGYLMLDRYTAEVITESAKYGRVTQRVLIFPNMDEAEAREAPAS